MGAPVGMQTDSPFPQLCEGSERWKHHYNATLAWLRAHRNSSTIDPFLTSVMIMIATQVILHMPGAFRERTYHLLESIIPLDRRSASVDVIFGCSLDLPKLMVGSIILH